MTKDEAVKIALKIIENDIDVKVNCSGAKKVIQDALTKQLPIKPIYSKEEDLDFCACCQSVVLITQNYCDFCGQKIEWTEGETENESIS